MRDIFFAIVRSLSILTVPYFRLRLPGWRRLAGLIGLPIEGNAIWDKASPRTIDLAPHRYRVTLDMRDWSERLTYFLGRHYDNDIAELIALIGRPGDTFVDVGANAGMTLLLAAWQLGPTGRILAFEANPKMAERLRQLVRLNNLSNVAIYGIALANEAGNCELTVFEGSSGWSTLAGTALAHAGIAKKSLRVRVERGDSILRDVASGPIVIKVDVEGYETQVIRGMTSTLEQLRPIVITEIEPALLGAAGSSVGQLFSALEDMGYRCFQRSRSTNSRRLVPVREPSDIYERDVIWCHPQSELMQRVEVLFDLSQKR